MLPSASEALSSIAASPILAKRVLDPIHASLRTLAEVTNHKMLSVVRTSGPS